MSTWGHSSSQITSLQPWLLLQFRLCLEMFTSGTSPGGPVATILSSQCRRPGFKPWSGNQILHAATKSSQVPQLKTKHTAAEELRTATEIRDPTGHNETRNSQDQQKETYTSTVGAVPGGAVNSHVVHLPVPGPLVFSLLRLWTPEFSREWAGRARYH